MSSYIARNGQTFGPYTDEQMREHLASGAVLLTDICCPEGNETWQPLYRALKPSKLAEGPYKIARNGVEMGEVKRDDLLTGSETRKYERTDHYWTPGLTNWLPLATLLNDDAKEYVIIERNGVQHGPYGPSDVEQYLAGGQLSCQDRAWVPGLARWTALQNLLDFLGVELQYFIIRGDEKFGPYSDEQMTEYHAAGNLGDGDVVTGTGGYESGGDAFAPSADLEDGGDDDLLAEINDDDSLAEMNDDDDLSDSSDDDALSDDDDDALSDDGGDDGWLSALGDDDD